MPPSAEPMSVMRPVSRSIDSAEIQLAGDVAAGLDIDPLDVAALGAGLVRHQLLAEHRARRRRDLVLRARELDAAGLAAAAGMDLRLDHPDLAPPSRVRRLDRLGGGVGDRRPRGTATPNFASSSFAWYSWMFILSASARSTLADGARPWTSAADI